jgi:hypothetical protein
MTRIALVLAIAAVGEGFVALHLVNQLRTERESAQALQARVAELEQRSQKPPAPGATFVAIPTRPPASPFGTVGKTAPTPPPPAAVAGTPTPNTFGNAAFPAIDQQRMRERMLASMERQRTLLRDPEYREAMRVQQKMGLRQSNPHVAKELNLSAEQVDRLFDTLAEQSLRAMDNMNATPWDEQPDPARIEEMQRKSLELQRSQETELKRVLGEAKYREWQEYRSLGGVRWEAERMRTALANAGVPLDESLSKPLMKTLQEQQQKFMQQTAANPSSPPGARLMLSSGGPLAFVDGSPMQDQTELMARSQRQQREALARVLTPEQLKVIEDEHNTQLQMQRAQQRIMRAQQEAGGLDPANAADAVGYFEAAAPAVPTSD